LRKVFGSRVVWSDTRRRSKHKAFTRIVQCAKRLVPLLRFALAIAPDKVGNMLFGKNHRAKN
jgi:hypothetical protein